MLERIKKLKSQKGRIDHGLKHCQGCGKEFTEQENFQWSCRVHRGNFSENESMWWCCGKIGKSQPGCKKTKHLSKEDEEEDEMIMNEAKIKNKKRFRCQCCKQLGH